MIRRAKFLLLGAGCTAFIAAIAQQPTSQDGPLAEQVYKNIQVFKGQPASDLIPSMQFMAASLHMECDDCHDPQDMAKDTRTKETARRMILMQRQINNEHFNSRNEVTCFTCHGGEEHPASTPLPAGATLRHPRIDNPPAAADLLAKAEGKSGATLLFSGTMTAPNDVSHKIVTVPATLLQSSGGKFVLKTSERVITSNGKETWYGPYPLSGEPLFSLNRIGQAWRGPNSSFSQLQKPTTIGREKLAKGNAWWVRGSNPTSDSTQDLALDQKTGLLTRMLNIKRSSLGTVVAAYDYSNYRKVGDAMVPMRVQVTYPGGEQWTLDFKTVKVETNVNDSSFTPPKAG